jgi:DNA-binding LacI/PurR family transcriptional regulator
MPPSTHPKRRGAPTLDTVAAAVGVSRMTVSNAFNRPDQLSPELRRRVLAAARDLGYGGPDPVARTLSRGETGSIGLVFDYSLTVALKDPATVELLHGVAAGCEEREKGLSLVPRIADRDEVLVHRALVDGFVLYCVTEDDPRLRAVRARRLPYVLIDLPPIAGARQVNIDDRGAARSMVDHLVALGHRRFGVVVGWGSTGATAAEAEANAMFHVDGERLAGWRAGLEAAGIDSNTVPVASGPGFDRETGRIAGGRLLDAPEPPTAVVTISDPLAIGVMDAAAERGIDVPGRLSVVGFDDVPAAAHASPPLTTVWQPHARKGAAAVRLVLEPGDRAEHVLLPTKLVVRSSTSPAP